MPNADHAEGDAWHEEQHPRPVKLVERQAGTDDAADGKHTKVERDDLARLEVHEGEVLQGRPPTRGDEAVEEPHSTSNQES